jgi:ribosomal protein S18 acetylase RimI-like enzyme
MDLRIELLKAAPGDETFLFDLFRAVRQGRFQFLPGGHPQMAVMVRLQFEAQESALMSRYPGSENFLILLDGAPIGRLRVSREETSFRLADISVLLACQRQGIGTAVVKGLMADAQQAGLPLHCTVSQSDHVTFQFYRKLGFEITHSDTAFVDMQWKPVCSGPP